MSRKRARARVGSGRLEFAQHDIFMTDMLKMWADQAGQCFYSGLDMTAKPGTDWQCSLERKDESRGYTKDNVAFCCLEFNNMSQWSREKLLTILQAPSIQHNTHEIDALITAAGTKPVRGGKPQKVQERVNNEVKEYKCNKCENWKPEEGFYHRMLYRCKECDAVRRNNLYDTIRGRLQKLISNAEKNAEARAGKDRTEAGVFEVDFEMLLNMLLEQHGLCAYSDIKLGYATGKPWLISLERRDPLMGYTRDNCCLIALEFNGSDQTAQYKDEPEGSAGWSREKVQFLRNQMRASNWSVDANRIEFSCEQSESQ
jgi:hypothetical protein